jgi:hypothetical protein
MSERDWAKKLSTCPDWPVTFREGVGILLEENPNIARFPDIRKLLSEFTYDFLLAPKRLTPTQARVVDFDTDITTDNVAGKRNRRTTVQGVIFSGSFSLPTRELIETSTSEARRIPIPLRMGIQTEIYRGRKGSLARIREAISSEKESGLNGTRAYALGISSQITFQTRTGIGYGFSDLGRIQISQVLDPDKPFVVEMQSRGQSGQSQPISFALAGLEQTVGKSDFSPEARIFEFNVLTRLVAESIGQNLCV